MEPRATRCGDFADVELDQLQEILDIEASSDAKITLKTMTLCHYMGLVDGRRVPELVDEVKSEIARRLAAKFVPEVVY